MEPRRKPKREGSSPNLVRYKVEKRERRERTPPPSRARFVSPRTLRGKNALSSTSPSPPSGLASSSPMNFSSSPPPFSLSPRTQRNTGGRPIGNGSASPSPVMSPDKKPDRSTNIEENKNPLSNSGPRAPLSTSEARIPPLPSRRHGGQFPQNVASHAAKEQYQNLPVLRKQQTSTSPQGFQSPSSQNKPPPTIQLSPRQNKTTQTFQVSPPPSNEKSRSPPQPTPTIQLSPRQNRTPPTIQLSPRQNKTTQQPPQTFQVSPPPSNEKSRSPPQPTPTIQLSPRQNRTPPTVQLSLRQNKTTQQQSPQQSQQQSPQPFQLPSNQLPSTQQHPLQQQQPALPPRNIEREQQQQPTLPPRNVEPRIPPLPPPLPEQIQEDPFYLLAKRGSVMEAERMPQRNACPSIYLGSRSDLQAQFEQLALEDEEEEREDERKREELRGSFSTMKLSTQTVDRRKSIALNQSSVWDPVREISTDGLFCVVNLVRNKKTGAEAAVKVMDVDEVVATMDGKVSAKEATARFELEVDMMRKMNFPHVVKIIDLEKISPTRNRTLVYMEYFSGGNLFTRMGPRGMAVRRAAYYFKQLALALQYVHSHKIIHCDVKIDNVLIDANDQIKLIDFGLSYYDEIGDQAKYFDGFTPYYVPPELAKSQSPSYASDVWSAGILLYATLTGKFPFPEGGPHRKKFSVYFGKVFNKDAKILLVSILNLYPENRPTFSQVLKSKFCKGAPKKWK